MNDVAEVYIDCKNQLGEGPLWHHGRGELLWFDIPAGEMHREKNGEVVATYAFDEPASACGIVDNVRVAVATASGLTMLDLETGSFERLFDIEADNAKTRSNDCRVNHAGGMWFGTMGRNAEDAAGRIYQFRKGKLDRVVPTVTISNSICFSPDGKTGYFADSPQRKIMKQAMNPDTGLPIGMPQVFFDLGDVKQVPDGAIVDSDGYVWSARWDGYCVVRHAPDGSIDRVIDVPTAHVTCPAFGGPDLKTLFITTARQGLNGEELAAQKHAGSIFAIEVDVPGIPEPTLLT